MWQSFEKPQHVITRYTDQTPGKWQSFDFRFRNRRMLHCVAKRVKILVLIFRMIAALVTDRQTGFIEAEVQRITKTEKLITSQPLTTLNTLEKIPRLELPEFQIRRYRCVQISCYVEWWLHSLSSGSARSPDCPVCAQAPLPHFHVLRGINTSMYKKTRLHFAVETGF